MDSASSSCGLSQSRIYSEAEIRRRDMVYKYYRESKIIWKYDPVPNGWCVYNALAQGMLDFPVIIAEKIPHVVRNILLKCLHTFHEGFLEFFGRYWYMKHEQVLQAEPDTEKNDWWGITPDIFWIAVVAYQKPVLIGGHGHEKNITLFNIPSKQPLVEGQKFDRPPCLFLQRHYHILVYRLEEYTYQHAHASDMQNIFNQCFQRYMQ